MNKFEFVFEDSDGTYVIRYWRSKGRYFRKVKKNGVSLKTHRISESMYIDAWLSY